MYKYETHLHTSPVSRCARATVRENLEAYKSLGYDGVFITNHFIDGNIYDIGEKDYKKRLDFFFSDYDEAVKIKDEIGIKVFLGAELSYKGSDFLVYGLDKSWYYEHPEIEQMTKRQELEFMMSEGALVIHAHPFREARYIDHIRLFPRSVHGVEIINSSRTPFENKMAEQYAKNYELLEFAGTDNHIGASHTLFAGMECRTPVESEADFALKFFNGELKIFTLDPRRMRF